MIIGLTTVCFIDNGKAAGSKYMFTNFAKNGESMASGTINHLIGNGT